MFCKTVFYCLEQTAADDAAAPIVEQHPPFCVYPTLKNSTISAAEYGVRADGNASRGNLVIENTTIEANQGIVVRKTTTAGYSVNLGAGVEIKANDEYDVVFTKGSDDAAYVEPTVAYSYTSVANFNVFPLGVCVNNAAELANL